MRRIRTEETPSQNWNFARKTLVAAWFAVSALTVSAGLTSAAAASETHGASVGPTISSRATPSATSALAPDAVDDIETGSIALPITQSGVLTTTLARSSGVDKAVAGSVASVHVPAYLSVLADRRVLAMLCLFGLLIVWINRTPPKNNRDL